MLTTYGIPEAAELCRKFHLSGLEVTLKRFTTRRGIDRIRGNVPIIGIHLPWEYDITWRAIVAWNRKAGIMANLKGKFAFLSQAETGKALRIGSELSPQPEYYVIHPDAFAKTRRVPWRKLRSIPHLYFENNWPENGYEGVSTASSFALKSNASVVLDTCHLGLVPRDAANLWQAYQAVKKLVKVIHLSDFDSSTGQEHLIPGRGNLGLESFIQRIAADGFKGLYVLEVRHPGVEPRQAIEESLKFLERCSIYPG